MKLERNDLPMLFSNTELSDVFFTEYLSQANGNYIKIYLYIVFLSKYGKDVKIDNIDLNKEISMDEFYEIQVNGAMDGNIFGRDLATKRKNL